MIRLRASVLLTAFLASALGAQQKVQEQVEVEITTLPAGTLDAIARPVLSPVEADEMLRSTRPTLTTWVPVGVEASLEAVTRRTYVKQHTTNQSWYPKVEDYEPVTGVLSPGMQTTIQVDPLPGGKLLVSMLGRRTTLESLRELACRGEHDLVVEVPSLARAEVSGSAPIEPGGALIIGTDAIPGAAWAVRVFAPPGVVRPRQARPGTPPTGVANPKRVVYDVRAGTVPRRTAVNPLLGGLDALAESLQNRALTTGPSGTSVSLFAGGVEATVEFDVEISQEAWPVDVIVEEVRTGLVLSCAAVVDGPGRAHLDGRVGFADLIRNYLFTTEIGGVRINCQIPELETTGAEFSADVPLGRWIFLHSAPLHGTPNDFVVMLRLTEL